MKWMLMLKVTSSTNYVMPTSLFLEAFDSIGPYILSIINKSLAEGFVPLSVWHAVVEPLLKKPGLDPCVLQNFHPISKLPSTAKIIEKVVFRQLFSFLAEMDIMHKFQSGFRTGYSSESALTRVFNDTLLEVDNGNSVGFVLLNLSAAFDTLDHTIFVLSSVLG